MQTQVNPAVVAAKLDEIIRLIDGTHWTKSTLMCAIPEVVEDAYSGRKIVLDDDGRVVIKKRLHCLMGLVFNVCDLYESDIRWNRRIRVYNKTLVVVPSQAHGHLINEDDAIVRDGHNGLLTALIEAIWEQIPETFRTTNRVPSVHAMVDEIENFNDDDDTEREHVRLVVAEAHDAALKVTQDG